MSQSYTGPRCAVCGAARPEEARHKHELPNWKPRYDDLEGALEGYEMEEEGRRHESEL